MMRLFIALPLGEDARRYLGSIIDDLKPYADAVKWVAPENVHLTLRFLGDTEEQRLPKIQELLDKVVSGQGIFETSTGRLGAFPNLRRPRVLWVGLDRNVEMLEKLARQVELGVRKLRFEKESKGFKPHLTLGRIRKPQGLDQLVERMESYTLEPLPLTLDRIVLFKSTLTPKGPIYERLHQAMLGQERFGG
ncbi:MAG: RNA 2',3'-cyclic phosphodiesterase [candidate division Zixibacteria bacterium]|nr:RNA 2',3'-cyclic phosphodiesterase [candidate division Zixibacteria bacterium]MDH3936948.1 RNA 2',3'-cyclic phosphodiesterase [candidate division Zixibacteria bacterium]MDH4033459.1 RNA 2',3'-cyclic phosphodiesterase [candidate division Zixibacteria bacterium]